jgi:hypothetical protein
MVIRTGMAKGSGVPIHHDPSADLLTKIGRNVGQGERDRVPIYQRMWQFLLGLGVVFIVVAGTTFSASLA